MTDRRESQVSEETLLRSLCDGSTPREVRLELLDSLSPATFTDPGHQIVFESVRLLLPLGPISAERLRVHLTRRGFPDTDVEPYFGPAT